MKTPWVAFLESNTSGTGRLFARASVECGYRPVVLAEKPERYKFLEQDLIRHLRCDTRSIESVSNVFTSLSCEGSIAGIFSSSEYFIESSAALAAQYGLAGADPVALRICRNKWTQRQFLQAAGFSTPQFECVSSTLSARLALERISLPVVVKPTLGSGSVGVRLCSTVDQVIQHAELLLSRAVNERGMPVPPELLIEEYLVGPEYSVEVFGGSLLGITRKHISSEPFFVELGHDFPAGLPPPIEQSVSNVSRRAVQALGLTWGPVHLELRVTARGPVIVEVNPRLAGGFITEIMRLALGVDVIRETIRLIVGEQPNLRPSCAANASIRFVVPSRPGTIAGISGIHQALAVQGVADVQIYREIGERVSIENDFRDRIGHVIARGDNETAASGAAELAREKIAIQIEAE